MKHATKSEAESAMLTLAIIYKMGKVSRASQTVAIKLSSLNEKEWQTVKNIIEKYSRKSRKATIKLNNETNGKS